MNPAAVPRTRQERRCAFAVMVVFWVGMAALLLENRAFDNTLGELRLVAIGLAVAAAIAVPSCVWIRRLAFASGDRWASCMFFVLGVAAMSVMGVTHVNHAMAGASAVQPLRVVALRWVPGSRRTSPRHWVTVRIDGQDKVLWVDADDFDSLAVGGDYAVPVQRGWFGMAVIGCVHRCK